MTDFPPVEYALRLAKAQAAMAAEGIDALLLTTEAEVRYFSGFRTAFWQSSTRPWFLIVPRDGALVAVVPELGEALMRATWVDDVRVWAAPHPTDDGVSLLRDALAGLGTVGMPMGRGGALRMGLTDFRRLGIDPVDASPLLHALRAVKSPAEVAAVAEICAIGGRAFARAGELFREGMALDAVFRAFRIALLGEGAEEVPYLVGGAGACGYADVISPPDETPLHAGDVLMLDTGASLRGYFCDFDRNFAIRRAEDAAKNAHAALWLATEAGLAAARPGNTCADVHAAMAKALGDADRGGVGRLGHGVGSEMTEEPSLAPFDQTVLVPGMILALEPSMATGPGTMMVTEENVVITDDAPVLLTPRATPDLPVIDA